MSLTSPRRDQRRRLLVAWNRSSVDAGPDAEPRSAAVSPTANDVVRLAGLAPLVPTGQGRFLIGVVAILAPAVAAATLTAWEPVTGRSFVVDGGRFAGTVEAIRASFAASSPGVAAWIAQMSLVLASGFALAVRSLQRHRKDDYSGRYRAWGWFAVLFVIASLAEAMPLGTIVSAALGDATGMRPGPGGVGWWIGIAAVSLSVVGAWAVLPMRERSTTALWLTALGLSWTAAAVGGWLTAAGTVMWQHQVLATRIAWWAGCSFALVTMIAATRAVIRELRGLVATRVARRKRGAAQATSADGDQAPSRPLRQARQDDERVESHADHEEDTRANDGTIATISHEEPDFVADAEDDEMDMRHLSKSERKRLRKLRKQRAAA